ncbi:MAG: DUF5668 domain-containing protein [Acidobacteriota bacterium]
MASRTASPRLVLGVILIVVGALLTLSRFGFLGIDFDLFDLWPLVFVAIGVARFRAREWVTGLVWGAIGVALLLPRLHPGIDFGDITQLWPLALVGFGVSLVFRSFGGDDPKPEAAVSKAPTGTVVLGKREVAIDSADYTGDGVTALMGTYDLDLTGAELAPGGAVLEVFAMWGGIVLRVPRDWGVDLRVIPLMGGAEYKTPSTRTAEPGEPRLLVRGFVLMGGIEIKS